MDHIRKLPTNEIQVAESTFVAMSQVQAAHQHILEY